MPANSNLILKNHTTTQLAKNLGAGLKLQLATHLNLTAEYVYGFMGNASPANKSTNNADVEHAARFTMQSQSLLFGLNITL